MARRNWEKGAGEYQRNEGESLKGIWKENKKQLR